jgi:hypothetical protein
MLALRRTLDDLPRKAVDFLPKFDGEGNTHAFEHI